ncbi:MULTISPECIES: 3-deoxy-7-phosphoheptulonate synthase [Syntrophothermus]|uniref:Phospho-2-dehydro-3-deoxyheptonate aldolase n=1 Tax=Syntrophothermus lipocalidus (strain DSM 12680 / TGB-C1) TaxID=643648 RepID=D7CP64_SYNLT|nr:MULTISPECIES: 3-deoxy-7-phosphoheptulonate synthase [Syntrophothermus]ADI02499.1 phospho-2-dehydro-3-deoxyheptonate aldolase [Syntrophothermus lipocalidus DSM 12680]NSW83426.1 3-deoxy-7-phosphoheptulonate synthase [Syntrophothermus sp.]HOV42706.1 3-deoxy-7-phosphoheptulonate synthase [Syntrophothermus lipocalidus]
MVIVMEKSATPEQVRRVEEKLKDRGFSTHLSQGVERTIIGAIGDRDAALMESLATLSGVERVVPILKPFKLCSREFKGEDTVVRVGDVEIGGGELQVIAGPCAVESREGFLEVAEMVKAAGATVLRGGAFKPRTSPYSFQGLEEEGLKILREARQLTGLPVITEVMDPRLVSTVCEYVDVLQIGARNMQNFFLLREVGKIKSPVVLKRGPSATIEEWLMAAEYIISSGNTNVILCERGIRTFETYTRNTLDLAAVPLVKQLTHLPVLVDPSHGTGKWKLVGPMACAAVAAGCDGLMVEVHQNPSEALSDGPQSLTPSNFERMMENVRRVFEAVSCAS